MFIVIYILVFFLYFININSITIYQCSNIDLLSQQCMLNWTDKNGNTHISLKICPNNKICKTNKDYSMGFCIDNLKNVLPGEKCNYRSECITNSCFNNICYGYGEHQYCNPKKKDCNPNLSCRLTYEFNELAYRCANLSKINTTCDINDHCELNLVCVLNKNLSEYNLTNYTANIEINDIKNLISLDEYLNITRNITRNKTCIRRASLKNGEISNEAMACQSGELIGIEILPGVEEFVCGSKLNIIKECDLSHKCIVNVDIGKFGIVKMEQQCIFSALGNIVCPLKEKQNAWKDYIEIYDKYLIKEDISAKRKSQKIHIPYDKDTLRNNEISEYFWKYNDWYNNIEVDECVKQYFFVNSKSKIIRYIKFLLITYIFLLY